MKIAELRALLAKARSEPPYNNKAKSLLQKELVKYADDLLRKAQAFDLIERHGMRVSHDEKHNDWTVAYGWLVNEFSRSPNLATAVLEASAKGGK